MDQEQATELAARLLGSQVRLTLRPFEHGWLVHRELTPEDQARGRGLGMGQLIVDRDGTVTLHSSLADIMIVREYSAARREGRYTGRQIWPEPTPAE